jgi:DNA-binding response OmpR family regulator
MPRSRILVVDDSHTLRVQLSRTLSRAGYDVRLAADGAEAMSKMREEPPDLLILDIQMPDMDGYGVCQELKRMGTPWNELPIIFLTSIESRALDLLGSAMGAYLRKPIGDAELLGTVADFVGPMQAIKTS